MPVSPLAAAAIDRIFAFIKKEQLKVIDMFFKIDVDGSGEIEPAEFVQAVSKMGLKLTQEELDAVVHEMDVDGDGFLSEAEIKALGQDRDGRNRRA